VAIKDGFDIHAKSLRIGKSLSAIRLNAEQLANVLRTCFQRGSMRQRLAPEELHARLIVAIGIILALVFAISIFSLLYAFLFITQPLGEQAPNDKAAIDLITTLTTFLTGTLTGLVSANGLKSKKKSEE
jgi:hypothetical protein